MHSGTYADDCICERIQQHKCYIVATCDRDLRRRIRKARLAWSSAGLCMLPTGFCGHGGVKRRPGAEGFVCLISHRYLACPSCTLHSTSSQSSGCQKPQWAGRHADD